MKLEAVCTCVDYSDFLKLTLPWNLMHFDRLAVVTSPSDRATSDLCASMGPTCVPVITDRFRLNGASFNKGAALNAGFPSLDRDGWIVHFDADVILPGTFREILESQDLDGETIYGANRMHLATYAQFDGWMRAGRNFPSAPLSDCEGVVGFFQLFSSGASALKSGPWYPDRYPDANRSDGDFTSKWTKRKVLPFSVVHLGVSFKNWKGRVTPLFAPPQTGA